MRTELSRRIACPSKPELPADRPVSPKIIARQGIIPTGGGSCTGHLVTQEWLRAHNTIVELRNSRDSFELGKLVQQGSNIAVVDILLDKGLLLQGRHSKSQLVLEGRHLHLEENPDRYLVAPLERLHQSISLLHINLVCRGIRHYTVVS